jgi:hypothetical protein
MAKRIHRFSPVPFELLGDSPEIARVKAMGERKALSDELKQAGWNTRFYSKEHNSVVGTTRYYIIEGSKDDE